MRKRYIVAIIILILGLGYATFRAAGRLIEGVAPVLNTGDKQ